MALPQTIGSSLELHNLGYAGPFRASNGDHYVILQDLTNKDRIGCFKADNGDNTWSRLDTANDPISSTVADYQGLTATLSGTVIHIASWGSSGSNRYVFYHNFDTSTDTWGTKNETVAGPFSTNIGDGSCSIEVRSDGDKVIFYQGPYEAIHTSNYDRIYYAVHQGTAWTDASGFFNTGENKQYRFVYSIKGASDKCHIFYSNENQTEVYHASLDSSNTASSAELVTSNSSSNPTTRPFYYDNGGAETVVIAIAESGTAYRYSVVNDGTPGGGQSVSDVTTYQPFAGGHYAIGIAADAATGKEYLAYIDSATQDLWYDARVSGSWGTDTEVIDAITGQRLCVNVFVVDNGDTVLAYVYNDNGTIKYHETVVEAAATGIVLEASGSIAITGSAAITLDSALTSSGNATITGSAALSMSNALSASGDVAITGAADLSKNAILEASGSSEIAASAALSMSNALSASGSIEITGAANLTTSGANAALDAAGTLAITGSAAITLDNALASSGSIEVTTSAGLTLDTTLSASGAIEITGTSALTMTTALTTSGAIEITSTADLTTSGGASVTLDAAGAIAITGNAAITLDSAMSASGAIAITGTSALSMATTMSASAALSLSASAALTASGLLAVDDDRIYVVEARVRTITPPQLDRTQEEARRNRIYIYED